MIHETTMGPNESELIQHTDILDVVLRQSGLEACSIDTGITDDEIYKNIVTSEFLQKLTQANPGSAEYRILMESQAGPKKLRMVPRIVDIAVLHDQLVAYLDNASQLYTLKHPDNDEQFEQISPSSKGLNDALHTLYRCPANAMVFVQAIGTGQAGNFVQRRPYIAIEQNKHPTGESFLQIRLCVDTDSDGRRVQEYSKLRTIRSIEFAPVQKDLFLPTVNRHTLIHGSTREPMRILSEEVEILQKNPLELFMAAANIVHEAVKREPEILTAHPDEIHERTGRYRTTPAIDHDSFLMLKNVLDELAQPGSERYTTRFHDAITRAALQGKPVMKEFLQFMYLCLDSIQSNPARFWRYLTALGLHKHLPRLAFFSDTKNEEIYNELSRTRAVEKFGWAEINSAMTDAELSDGEFIYDTLRPFYQDETRMKDLLIDYPFAANLLRRNYRSGIQRIASYLGHEADYEAHASAIDTILHVFNPFPVTGRRIDAFEYFDFRELDGKTERDVVAMLKCINIAHDGMKKKGEDPFGALVLDEDGTILAEVHNAVLETEDLTNHAELIAIREARKKRKLSGKNSLEDCTLYSTVEPCHSCGYHGREIGLSRFVFALGSKTGSFTEETSIGRTPFSSDLAYLGNPPDYTAGVLAHIAGPLLRHAHITQMILWEDTRTPTIWRRTSPVRP